MQAGKLSYKPDFTAWFVAQGTIATMYLPAFYDTANEDILRLYKILSGEAGKTRILSRIIEKLPYTWQYNIGELVTNKGRLRHFYLRKKEIEKQTRKILAGGDIGQVVVLGAGLDVLALRLAPECPQIKFIEIDLPPSQEFKLEALRKHAVKIAGNLEFVSGDLRNPLPEILAQSKFYNTQTKTLWICEGLFMFIPEADVIRLFLGLYKASQQGSYVIFTTLPPKGRGGAMARLIQNLYMNKEQCLYHWEIAAQLVPGFMKKLNMQIITQIDSSILNAAYMPNVPNLGDDINVAKI